MNTRTRIASGVVAILAALAAAFVVMSADTPATDGRQAASPDGGVSEVLPQEETEADAVDVAALLAEADTFEVFLARDPFDPVIPAVDEGGTGGDPTSPTDPTTPTDPSDPSDPSDPGDPSDPSDPGGDDLCSGTQEVVCEGILVELVDVIATNGVPTALVRVDGVVFEVQEGDIFADFFQVLSISGDCVTLLYGDDAFTLCESDQVLK